MSSAKNKIAIVVPIYNEEKRLGSVLSELKKLPYPIYVVDDGSTDSGASLAKRYRVNVLQLEINKGKGAAMRVGAEKAFSDGASAIIFMDGDGQHKSSDMHYFIDALQIGEYDVVFGSRNLSLGVPLVRYLGNKFASVFINLLFQIYVSDLICGYRAITQKAFKKMTWTSERYGVETEMVVLAGKHKLKYCEVPVEVVYYDTSKGVTVFHAVPIFFDVLKWKLLKR